MTLLAHIGHWYHSVLYLVPILLVGIGLWWTGGSDDEDEDEFDELAAGASD